MFGGPAALGFLVLPAILKSQAQQLAADKLQRRLSIGELAFNPFTLVVSVQEFKLTEPKAETVFASFDSLTVDLDGASLWSLAPVVRELRLERPQVHLVRGAAGHYNIDDILALAASQPASPEPARFALNNIQVEQGGITFDDVPAGASHSVTALQFGLPFLSSMPSDVALFVEPLFSARVNGVRLQVKCDMVKSLVMR